MFKDRQFSALESLNVYPFFAADLKINYITQRPGRGPCVPTALELLFPDEDFEDIVAELRSYQGGKNPLDSTEHHAIKKFIEKRGWKFIYLRKTKIMWSKFWSVKEIKSLPIALIQFERHVAAYIKGSVFDASKDIGIGKAGRRQVWGIYVPKKYIDRIESAIDLIFSVQKGVKPKNALDLQHYNLIKAFCLFFNSSFEEINQEIYPFITPKKQKSISIEILKLYLEEKGYHIFMNRWKPVLKGFPDFPYKCLHLSDSPIMYYINQRGKWKKIMKSSRDMRTFIENNMIRSDPDIGTNYWIVKNSDKSRVEKYFEEHINDPINMDEYLKRIKIT